MASLGRNKSSMSFVSARTLGKVPPALSLTSISLGTGSVTRPEQHVAVHELYDCRVAQSRPVNR